MVFLGVNGYINSLVDFSQRRHSSIAHHVPKAAVVIDGTEIRIPASSNLDIDREEYSTKKKIHSVNVLVVILLNG